MIIKFKIDYSDNIKGKSLLYYMKEYSFDTEPSVQYMNFDIVINKLNLTVSGEDNRIVQLWGYGGGQKWIKSSYNVPPYKKGILKVMNDLESGLAYGVSKDDFPVYININDGWICIGDPEKKGSAVEFINNCVAVIDDNGEFVSLWLQPRLVV